VAQGFPAQERESPQELLLGRGEEKLAGAFPLLQDGTELEKDVPFLFALGILHLFQVPVEFLETRLDHGQIRKDEFFFHEAHVLGGAYPPPGVGDSRVREPPDDVNEAVGGVQMGEEEAALDFAEGDPDEVREIDVERDLFLVRVQESEPVEPGIRDGAGPQVRLPLSVAVGRHGDVRPGQDVEQRGFPRLRVAEQDDVHGCSKARIPAPVKDGGEGARPL